MECGWGVGGRMWVGGWKGGSGRGWEFSLCAIIGERGEFRKQTPNLFSAKTPAKPDPKPIRAEPVDLEPVGG